MQTPSQLSIYVRMIVCMIGLLLPLLVIAISGEYRPSVSNYFYTSAGPFLIFSLGLISYTMMQEKTWVPSGVLLAMVAIFPNVDYPYIHNISAIVFFIISTAAITFDKRYRWMGFVMMASSFLTIHSLMLAESVLIPMISAYHLHRLSVIQKILKR